MTAGLLLALARPGTSAVLLDDPSGRWALGPHLEVLADPTGGLSLTDVTSPPYAARFVPFAQDVPNFGLTTAAYWVRFAWRTPPGAVGPWVLEMAWPVVDDVTAYVPAGGEIVVRHAGDRHPFVEWDVPYHNPTFRFAPPADAAGVAYLRVRGDDTMLLPLVLWSAAAFDAKRRTEAFAYGAFYGVVAILLVYHLVLWAMLRDRSHRDYVFLIAAWGFYHASLAGFATQFLWPTRPWPAQWSIHVAASLAFTGSAVFARSFLMTHRYAPRLDRALAVFVGIGSVFLLWPLVGSVRWFIPTGGAIGLTGSVLLLVSGYWCWQAGYRPARWYLLTWTVAISALFVWALRGFGIAPSNFVTDRSFELVVLSTAITLSLGLADRINVLRDDLQSLNRDLERRIAERTADLARANRHKSEFLANMSHELRTPLNAIIGFSQALAARMFGDLTHKQAEYVDHIQVSGRHLLALINDVLDLSKVEAGRMELVRSEFAVGAAIETAVTLVRERAHRQGVSLGVTIDDDVGTIVADERKVKQVLVNLLANAVTFSPAGGTVQVRARHAADTIEIAVCDDGVGIAPEDQAVIFEDFRQVGSTGARRTDGTGLGLALAKRMAELHGGTLRVESAVGRGSTFTFALPRGPWPEI